MSSKLERENDTDTQVDLVTSNAGITSFVGDTVKNEVSLVNSDVVPLLAETKVSDNQDIKQFLARPVLLRSGVITSASASGSLIRAMAVPSEMIYTNSVTSEKVKGFTAFRGTMVLRVIVNANRFSLGRIRLSYMPAATINKAYPNNRLQTLTQITALPGVELDIAGQSEAVLRIPFNHPFLFYDLTTSAANTHNSGAVYLHIYSAIDSGGGNDPEYQIYSHFEDVVLEIPAYKFQMGRSKGVRNIVASVGEAMDAEAQGPLTSLADTVSSTANFVSELHIPIISDVASSVGWFSDIIGSVASIFGWSKPALESELVRMVPDPYVDMNHFNGNSISRKLAYSKSNKVLPVTGVSYTDLDETTIKGFAATFAFYNSFTLAEVDTIGALTYVTKVVPDTFQTTSAVGATGSNCVFKTPLAFCATPFGMWRGSIKFKLKFVKSQFHTGRVAVCLFPSPSLDNTGNIPGYSSTSYVMREIVDLQSTSEMEFTVPYLSYKPYSNLSSNIDRSTGATLLCIYVVNPLRAIADCAVSIQVLVEVAGGDDIEFIGVNFNDLTSYGSVTPLITNTSAFATQMGVETKLENERDTVLGDKSLNLYTDAAKFCSGELMVSLTALSRVKTAISSTAAGTTDKISVKPFLVFGAYSDGVTVTLNEWRGDLLSYVMSAFAYSRGSVEYFFSDYLNESNLYESFLYNTVSTNTCVDYFTNWSTNKFFGPLCMAQTRNTNGLHVVVPPYLNAMARVNRMGSDSGSTNTTSLATDEFSGPYRLGFKSSKVAYVQVLRSAGDDFQMLGFWGLPPFLI